MKFKILFYLCSLLFLLGAPILNAAENKIADAVAQDVRKAKKDVQNTYEESKKAVARDAKELKKEATEDFREGKKDVIRKSTEVKKGLKQELKEVSDGLKAIPEALKQEKK